ncbi:Tn3 family transposase [Streptomyces sp. NPDC057582]|uniref:Tn3 family transposase n=1 Tax=Streptomyces sp. NPDC057582 TaxID=3346174 RepID=UPI00369845B4
MSRGAADAANQRSALCLCAPAHPQEDQLASLGRVLDAVVLWNTRYLDAAVAQLRAGGHDLKDEDVAVLSPLKDRHINFVGRSQFNFAASGPGEGPRPLRDPDAPEPDEDDDGGQD